MMPTPIKIKIARITKAIFPFDDLDFAFRPGVVDTVLFIVAVLFLIVVGVVVVVVVVVDVVPGLAIVVVVVVVVVLVVDEVVAVVVVVGVVLVVVVVVVAVVVVVIVFFFVVEGISLEVVTAFTRLQLNNSTVTGADVVRCLLSVVKSSVLSIFKFTEILVLMTTFPLTSILLSLLMI